jgi:hypothetical protein
MVDLMDHFVWGVVTLIELYPEIDIDLLEISPSGNIRLKNNTPIEPLLCSGVNSKGEQL